MTCLPSASPVDFLTSSSQELNKLLDAFNAEIKNLAQRVSSLLHVLEGLGRVRRLNVVCNRQVGAMHTYLGLN